MARTEWASELTCGLELDFNPVGSFWVLSRVERVQGSLVTVRFSCGRADVAHVLDCSAAATAKRFAPAGEYTVMLLRPQRCVCRRVLDDARTCFEGDRGLTPRYTSLFL